MSGLKQTEVTVPSPEHRTYEASDVPKWKLDRFREWIAPSHPNDQPDALAGRPVRLPNA